MSQCLKMLDQALELGARELSLLSSGEVDEAHGLSQERGRLMALAWENRGDTKLDDLLGKLSQLQSLQGRLTSEALRLRDIIQKDLKRTGQETTRMAGYAKVAKNNSGYSRFISKQS